MADSTELDAPNDAVAPEVGADANLQEAKESGDNPRK